MGPVDDPTARVRRAYDTVAEPYARLVGRDLTGQPWERRVLDALVAVVDGPVLDAGCGTGRTTGHLHALGVDVRGVDLSPRMVAVARRDHPGIAFAAGDLAALDEPDGQLSAVLAWYCLIHVAPADRPVVTAELARVLRPGGHLLVAFQVGTAHLRRTSAYGRAVDLDVWRLHPEELLAVLDGAGFEPVTRWDRPAGPRETTPQAALLLRRRSPHGHGATGGTGDTGGRLGS